MVSYRNTRKSEIFKFIEKVGSSHLDKFPRTKFLSEEIKNKYTSFQKLGSNKIKGGVKWQKET